MENLSKKQLLEENKMLRQEVDRLNHEMTLMREKMDLLIRRMFGRSSEKMDANQLDLFLLGFGDEPGKGEASSLQEADPAKNTKARCIEPRRERWPSDLPVIEEIIEPAEVVAAPEDWQFLRKSHRLRPLQLEPLGGLPPGRTRGNRQ